ncbi:hypothetical protein EC973_002639 [Apophysomyces ossiformis]|uniref:Uncharacterized protein n=1 Tax=Apophysomyces ossiformis TaxID=679940 RepID=A0A8H7BMM9_9FUNG|nr:hypothetical protein EC973_002639 [Apophysomyces ossiformis]
MSSISSDDEFYDAKDAMSPKPYTPSQHKDHLPGDSPLVDPSTSDGQNKRMSIDPLSAHIIRRTSKLYGSNGTISVPAVLVDDDEPSSSPSCNQKNINRDKDAFKSEPQEHDKSDNMLQADPALKYGVLHKAQDLKEMHFQMKSKSKGNKDFSRLVLAQTLATAAGSYASAIGDQSGNGTSGAIWIIEFSKDGKYMAIGGQNCLVQVWKVLNPNEATENTIKVFEDLPVHEYRGHTADILDLSWSKDTTNQYERQKLNVQIQRKRKPFDADTSNIQVLVCIVVRIMKLKSQFSDDGKYIVCGSEDHNVYLWGTEQVSFSPFHYLQDESIKAAAAVGHFSEQFKREEPQSSGWLKRSERKMKDKWRNCSEYFEAHQDMVTSTAFAPTNTRQLLYKTGHDIIYNYTPISQHMSVEDDDHQVVEENSATEASGQAKDEYKFSEGQIIVSADFQGCVKVWRMDSGVYPNQQAKRHSIDSASLNTKSVSSGAENTSRIRRRPFGNLFSSRSSK